MADDIPHPGHPHNAPGYQGDEGTVWEGQPGQITNWIAFAACLIACAVIVVFVPWPYTPVAAAPLAAIVWFYVSVRVTVYQLSNQRLRVAWGVLTRRVEEIELYRIEDTGTVAPLIYRMAGRGNAFVVTSDRTAPVVVLEAIKNHEGVRRQIRELVEAARRAKGVRLIE